MSLKNNIKQTNVSVTNLIKKCRIQLTFLIITKNKQAMKACQLLTIQPKGVPMAIKYFQFYKLKNGVIHVH